MAITETPTQSPFGSIIFIDTDANATAEDGFAGTKRVYMVDINNPSAEKVYVKLWDAASATVGSDAVDCLLPCAAGSAVAWVFPGGLDFATGITSACVQEAGDAGTTAPSSAVTVKILTN